MNGYQEGQQVRHGQYGIGTIVATDDERTSIDFTDHGTKKFVTSMVVLEITEDQPQPRKRKKSASRRKTSKTKK